MNFEDKKINLGCGFSPMPRAGGWVNHDLKYHSDFIDIAWDLNCLPLPFKDLSFVEVKMNDVIEHVNNPFELINETHRVCKPGAILFIRTSSDQSPNGWTDPTHKRLFTIRTFDYFDPRTDFGSRYGFYTDRKWEIISKEIEEGWSKALKVTMKKI